MSKVLNPDVLATDPKPAPRDRTLPAHWEAAEPADGH